MSFEPEEPGTVDPGGWSKRNPRGKRTRKRGPLILHMNSWLNLTEPSMQGTDWNQHSKGFENFNET